MPKRCLCCSTWSPRSAGPPATKIPRRWGPASAWHSWSTIWESWRNFHSPTGDFEISPMKSLAKLSWFSLEIWGILTTKIWWRIMVFSFKNGYFSWYINRKKPHFQTPKSSWLYIIYPMIFHETSHGIYPSLLYIMYIQCISHESHNGHLLPSAHRSRGTPRLDLWPLPS